MTVEPNLVRTVVSALTRLTGSSADVASTGVDQPALSTTTKNILASSRSILIKVCFDMGFYYYIIIFTFE